MCGLGKEPAPSSEGPVCSSHRSFLLSVSGLTAIRFRRGQGAGGCPGSWPLFQRTKGAGKLLQSASDVLETIKAEAWRLGRAPTLSEALRAGLSRKAVRCYFGTYNNALKATGFPPNRELRNYRHWNRETILQSVRDLTVLLGRTPTVTDIRDFPEICPPLRTVRKYFGSFRDLLVAAGLEPEGHTGNLAVRRLGAPGLGAARAWFRGEAACGCCPQLAEMRAAAGESGFALIQEVVEGDSLKDKARQLGLSRDRTRRLLVESLKKLETLVPQEHKVAFYRHRF